MNRELQPELSVSLEDEPRFSAVSTPAMNIRVGIDARSSASEARRWWRARHHLLVTSGCRLFQSPRKNLASSWPTVGVIADQRDALQILRAGMPQQSGDLDEPSGPVCQKYGFGSCVVSVSPEFIGVICGVFASMSRSAAAGWPGQRHAEDEDRSLVDQFAGQRRRDIRARLVVLDEQLDLAASTTFAVDSAAPKRVPSVQGSDGLGNPTRSVITPSDGFLRKGTCGEQRRATASSFFMRPSSSIEQIPRPHPSYTKIDAA